MIEVTRTISLDESEIVERFVRASGPGGQHVNKTSSAVELRFDVRNSPSLSEEVKSRLERLAGQRLTSEGVIVIFAQTHSAQQLNRADALDRLLDLIRKAAHVPKARKPTKPTRASKLRHLESKKRRGGVKAMRGRPAHD
jgi:ribosome-associated protein